jgi:hypothetical protein
MRLLQNLDQSNQEEEIKSLKTKVINLTEEMEELNKHGNKRK